MHVHVRTHVHVQKFVCTCTILNLSDCNFCLSTHEFKSIQDGNLAQCTHIELVQVVVRTKRFNVRRFVFGCNVCACVDI